MVLLTDLEPLPDESPVSDDLNGPETPVDINNDDPMQECVQIEPCACNVAHSHADKMRTQTSTAMGLGVDDTVHRHTSAASIYTQAQSPSRPQIIQT